MVRYTLTFEGDDAEDMMARLREIVAEIHGGADAGQGWMIKPWAGDSPPSSAGVCRSCGNGTILWADVCNECSCAPAGD